MAKGRWKLSDEQIAIEAYLVLMTGDKEGRALSKSDLKEKISFPLVYREFLKHCLEHDNSRDLAHFRKGLLMVVKAVGVSNLSIRTGLSRLSLYRMLAKSGNPRLDSLLTLFRALGMNFWLVDDDFIRVRQKLVRPKDIPSALALPKRVRKPGQ